MRHGRRSRKAQHQADDGLPKGAPKPGMSGRGIPASARSEGRRDVLPLRWGLLATCVICLAGVAAYHNSFCGPFVFDDAESITENPNVRSLWPIWKVMWSSPGKTVSGRPVLGLSVAVNYAISGQEVWSYHALNLAIHVLAGTALFGIVRRSLLTDRLRGVVGGRPVVPALVCAVVWVVHPLQTQAVTYVIQRAESLMGLFYLLTLYCAIRGWSSGRSRLWSVASVVACALGMGTKEVMATAPIMVALYDRVFLAGSWRQTVRRRWPLYVGLMATWGILAGLAASNPRSGSAGFGIEHVGPVLYAITQCHVVIHYLRLAFWPHPLVLDYMWKYSEGFAEAAPWAAGLGLLLAGVAVALRYRPAIGYAGAWFLIILSPTSSFVPVFDAAFEHRMYLPLAAVVSLSVCLAYALGKRLAEPSPPRQPGRSTMVVASAAGWVLAASAVGVLGTLTCLRNNDYRTAVSIWQATIQQRPANARAYSSLATALETQGDLDGAMRNYDLALTINPAYAPPYNGRGMVFVKKHDYQSAIRDFNKAVQLDPGYSQASNNRGNALMDIGRLDEAIADFSRAIELDPNCERAYCNRAKAHGMKGLYDLAIWDSTKAIQLDPNYAKAYNNRGVALAAKGDPGLLDRAIADFSRAIELDPRIAVAYGSRGLAYAQRGQFAQAIGDLNVASRLDPNDVGIRRKMQAVLEMQNAAAQLSQEAK